MKSGDKYIIQIGQVMKDANGKEYAKIKGFNTLIFDDQGLDKLQKYSDASSDDLAEVLIAGQNEAWTLAQRIAETSSKDIISAGIKYNPTLYHDEYEISCSAILENDFAAVKKKFEDFDRKYCEEESAAESIEDILVDIKKNKTPAFNKFFIEAVIDAYNRLKEEQNG